MKIHLAVFLLVLTAACASWKAGPAEPEVTVVQLSSEPGLAEHITGSIPVRLRVTVTNKAAVPITLKRTDVQSVGAGAYSVSPTSNASDLVIAPGATESIDFWVAAYATSTIAGVNGPVTLRVTTEYEGPSGRFRNILTRPVTGRM